jgi:hypothetical protein
MIRRDLLKTIVGLSCVVPKWGRAETVDIDYTYHDSRGNTLLADTLHNNAYWDDAQKYTYTDQSHDSIYLKNTSEGYITYISGTGKELFTPEWVSEGIFAHQDLIPPHMPALLAAKYIGRGKEPVQALAYRDIYFLADIKVFYMSVPLRTVKYALGGGRYICAIELITPDMVDAKKWKTYQTIMQMEIEQKIQGWMKLPVVPMEYLVGYYLVEPEANYGARVTMVTKMKFYQDLSFFADIGSELPFVLRQGMSAGFFGSVQACREYKKMQEVQTE